MRFAILFWMSMTGGLLFGAELQMASRFRVTPLTGGRLPAITNISATDVNFTVTGGLASGESQWGFLLAVDPFPAPFTLFSQICNHPDPKLSVWVYRNGLLIHEEVFTNGFGTAPLEGEILVGTEQILIDEPLYPQSRYTVAVGYYDPAAACLPDITTPQPVFLGVEELIWSLSDGIDRVWNLKNALYNSLPDTAVGLGAAQGFTFYYHDGILDPLFDDNASQWKAWANGWATNHGSEIALTHSGFESVAWILTHHDGAGQVLASLAETQNQPQGGKWLYQIPDPNTRMGIGATDNFELEARARNVYGITGAIKRPISSLRTLHPRLLQWNISYSTNQCSDTGILSEYDPNRPYVEYVSYQRPTSSCNGNQSIIVNLTGLGSDPQSMASPSGQDYQFTVGMLHAKGNAQCITYDDSTLFRSTGYTFDFNQDGRQFVWAVHKQSYTGSDFDQFIELAVTQVGDNRSDNQWLNLPQHGATFGYGEWTSHGGAMNYRMRLKRNTGFICNEDTAVAFHDGQGGSSFVYDGTPLKIYFDLDYDTTDFNPNGPLPINHAAFQFTAPDGQPIPVSFADQHPGTLCPDVMLPGNQGYYIELPGDLDIGNGTMTMAVSVTNGATFPCATHIPGGLVRIFGTASIDVQIPDTSMTLTGLAVSHPEPGVYASGPSPPVGSVDFSFQVTRQGATPSGLEWYWQRNDGKVWDNHNLNWIDVSTPETAYQLIGSTGFAGNWAYDPNAMPETVTANSPPFAQPGAINHFFELGETVSLTLHARLVDSGAVSNSVATALTVRRHQADLSLVVFGANPVPTIVPTDGSVNFGFAIQSQTTPTNIQWRWKKRGQDMYWDQDHGVWNQTTDHFHTVGSGSTFASYWAFDGTQISAATPPFATSGWLTNFFDGEPEMPIDVEARPTFPGGVTGPEITTTATIFAGSATSAISALQGSANGVTFYPDNLNTLASQAGGLVFRVATTDTVNNASNLKFDIAGPGYLRDCESITGPNNFSVTFDPNGYYHLTPSGSLDLHLRQVGEHTLDLFSQICGTPSTDLRLVIHVNADRELTIRYHYRDHVGSSSITKAFTTIPATLDQEPTLTLPGLDGGCTDCVALYERAVETTIYNPFGTEASADAGQTVRARYTDHEQDQTSGFHYMKGRYQLAALAKFNRPDPRLGLAKPPQPKPLPIRPQRPHQRL